MKNYVLDPSSTALDIRTSFALAKIYQRFDLGQHETMMNEALQAAVRYPVSFSMSEEDLVNCPVLFVDEPQLAVAWQEGVEIQRAWLLDLPNVIAEMELEEVEGAAEVAYLEYLKTNPMPTGAELLAALLAGERVEVECHRLGLDEDGIWVVNPYGIDAAIVSPTVEACDNFIRQMRLGVEYGPTPS